MLLAFVRLRDPVEETVIIISDGTTSGSCKNIYIPFTAWWKIC
jgi:hypothetical protein